VSGIGTRLWLKNETAGSARAAPAVVPSLGARRSRALPAEALAHFRPNDQNSFLASLLATSSVFPSPSTARMTRSAKTDWLQEMLYPSALRDSARRTLVFSGAALCRVRCKALLDGSPRFTPSLSIGKRIGIRRRQPRSIPHGWSRHRVRRLTAPRRSCSTEDPAALDSTQVTRNSTADNGIRLRFAE